jgi:DnaJ-class molecular chaperone
VPTAEQEVIHGAYRALAVKYHPDRDATRRAADKMAALNRAYAVLRDERSRAAHDRSHRTTLRDLARQDPDYLLWLSRHSSGIRYRTEIYGILRTSGVSAA